MKNLKIPKNAIIAPSLLAADFSRLKDEILSVDNAGAEWLHLDVMDGHFVPNLTIGPPVIKSIRPVTKMIFDCHLMVTEPDFWIDSFADVGADVITVHVEAAKDLSATFSKIKSRGCFVGLSLNPDTPLEKIEPYLDQVDLVLVMSVHPGFTGQKFIESSVEKIKNLNHLRGTREFLIEVDGGVSLNNVLALRKAGADVFVAGAAVFYAQNRNESVMALRKQIGE